MSAEEARTVPAEVKLGAAQPDSPPAGGASAQVNAGVFVGVAVLLVALLLRAPISSVPPALATIAGELGLSHAAAGLATSLPLICFGAFAFLTPVLSKRFGPEITLWVALVLMALGLATRSVPAANWFFLGITLVGMGIAVGNVIIPAIIRTRFPLKVPFMMGMYSLGLQISAAIGAASTEPLLGQGAGWPVAIGVWLVPAVLIGLVWTVVTIRLVRQHNAGGVARATTTSVSVVARRMLTVAICIFMGLQSLCFYALLTWIPQILVDGGMTPAQAGILLTVFSMLGMPGSFLGPRVASSRWGPAAIVIIFLANAGGASLLLLHGVWMVLGIAICGLCQGVLLAVALTFIARQRNPADVPAVSAIAQGVGYTVAAAGPFMLGVLYSATETWVWPLIFLMGIYVLAACCGAWAARASAAANTSAAAEA